MKRPEPMGRLATVALLAALTLAGAAAATRAEEAGGAAHPHIERQDWSFGGFAGRSDKAQLQRG
ncbi:MAG: cytochrome c1, partial [Hyphomicrobium sp.]|nr:cytochrome c1 [Hyphomicrobium sp.]